MVIIMVAGVLAGATNTVIGSGTLITFPVLLWLGIPPVQANIANNIGLAPGSLSGAIAYRSELKNSRSRLSGLAFTAAAGALIGASLLLILPSGIFVEVAPWLIGFAVLLMVFQDRIARVLNFDKPKLMLRLRLSLLAITVFLSSVYGAYFGAGQGVILLSAMTILMTEGIQQINALKNFLQGIDNTTSAILYVILGNVRWWVVLSLALGAALGGHLGAYIAKRLSPLIFRIIVVVIGVIGIVRLVS